MRILLLSVLLAVFTGCSQPLETPAQLRNYQSATTAAEVVDFSRRVAQRHPLMQYHPMGYSEGGSELASVRIRSGEAIDPLRVLVFAQQHGSEQSGKEALLLLMSRILSAHHAQWPQRLDLWVVPQLNPEGSDQNQRRNAGGIDLNRDHIVQLAPETRALHELFREFMPHVTIDIHEYMPFRESWEEFGAFKTFDVQVGTLTNINIDAGLRETGLHGALPHIEHHLLERGYSFHNYIVGPVPGTGRTRHSTVDFDDGRQSFGILNTLAFIFEGINGRDGYLEDLERRTWGQYEAVTALLDYLYEHHLSIAAQVNQARGKLQNARPGEAVAIRMEHFPGHQPLTMTLTSSRTGRDTLVVEHAYHPMVKATLQVTRPTAYLVPRNMQLLMDFLHLHRISYTDAPDLAHKQCFAYHIESIQASEDEELNNRFAQVVRRSVSPDPAAYVWVPTAQLHSNFLVSLFEPQSMLGLAQRPGFEELLQQATLFPIIRVE
ncbi:MAG: M14 family zinc carboxypeptidase [Bacteroidales bacterium]